MSALNGLSDAFAANETLPCPGRSVLLEGCERAAGLFLLAAASPVIAVSAALLGIAHRASPVIAHRRMGRNSTPFWMLKLRTMQPNGTRPVFRFGIDRITSEPDSPSKFQNDPRVSNKFAAFCRRHSIDELPQLWHVVTGEMSLLGPRPLTLLELQRYYGPLANEVLAVKPGLTGLWQVHGRSFLTMPERVYFDLTWVRSRSTRMRLRIFYRTIRAIITGYGAW